MAWLLPVTVERLHDGDLHAVDCGVDPRAMATTVKAIRVELGIKIRAN